MKLKIKVKIWIENEDKESVFGDGRLTLIKTVDETGSINSAAAKMGMSFRSAWGLIKKTEERLGVKILNSQIGGKKGGGSTLTKEMKEFICEYEKMRNDVNKYVEKKYEKLKL